MSWNKHRSIAIAFCAAFFAISSAATSRAGCCDWLFGKGQTTYSMPYTAPTVYVSNYSVVPAQPACCATVANYAPACSTCAPACSTCAPTTAYRIAYRPVPTVAYMPVTSVDSCSGCAVTMYQPARTWTYYGSLVPYSAGYAGAGYAAPACSACNSCSSCGGCSTCGVAPPSGYSSCYGGCSSCGVPASGCSSCSAGVTSSYAAAPSGCSSCGVGGTLMPGPAEMSQPPVNPSTTIIPSSPATLGAPAMLGAPALAPTAPLEVPAKTYAPNSGEAPLAPGAPAAANGNSTDNRSFRLPAATEAGRTVDPPHVQGVPPVVDGPRLMAPTPAPLPEGSDRVTSLPVIRASYFQLLPPPPATVPARTVSSPSASSNLPADDAGWVHVER